MRLNKYFREIINNTNTISMLLININNIFETENKNYKK
jgi:hypothetical protein